MCRTCLCLLSLCCVMALLAACRGNADAAAVTRKVSQTLATRAALVGAWQLRGTEAPGTAATVDSILTFEPDGRYALTSAKDGAELQSGSYRFASEYLVLESPGCHWPPVDLSGRCTGIYTFEVVYGNGSPDTLHLRLVKDKDNPARGFRLGDAVLVGTAPSDANAAGWARYPRSLER